jgi:hypothetical protein
MDNITGETVTVDLPAKTIEFSFESYRGIPDDPIIDRLHETSYVVCFINPEHNDVPKINNLLARSQAKFPDGIPHILFYYVTSNGFEEDGTVSQPYIDEVMEAIHLQMNTVWFPTSDPV